MNYSDGNIQAKRWIGLHWHITVYIDNAIFVVVHPMECACDEPLSVTADSASRHQFSPRVAPTSRVCLGEHRYDPQSSKGAEQVTAHSKMSQLLHNPCMYCVSGQATYTRSEVFQREKKVKTFQSGERHARLASCKRLAWKQLRNDLVLCLIDYLTVILCKWPMKLWKSECGFVKLLWWVGNVKPVTSVGCKGHCHTAWLIWRCGLNHMSRIKDDVQLNLDLKTNDLWLYLDTSLWLENTKIKKCGGGRSKLSSFAKSNWEKLNQMGIS